jgi:NAD+ diphosphatase
MIFSTPRDFTPATKETGLSDATPIWFIFKKNELLVLQKDLSEALEIPNLKDPSELGISIGPHQFIGHYGDQPCYTAVVNDISAEHDSFIWSGLRSLFGQLDDELFSVSGRAFQIADWYRSNRFCGHCGTENTLQEGERCLVCPSCGQLHYPRVSPAVMVMIQKGDEFLLARSPHFIPGMYSALAGFAEPGETLEETVHREVYEEVGIRVKNIRYYASQPWPFPHSLMIAFHADYESGEINIDPNEIEDANWFSANKLPDRLPGLISISRKLIEATLHELKQH